MAAAKNNYGSLPETIAKKEKNTKVATFAFDFFTVFVINFADTI